MAQTPLRSASPSGVVGVPTQTKTISAELTTSAMSWV